MKETYDTARKLMKGYCRVCPECNGIACAGQVPGMGGLGTAASFKENVIALGKIRFNMRLIHNVTEPDLSISLLGRQMALPLMAAPIGGVSFNMGGQVSEEEYIRAIVVSNHGGRVLDYLPGSASVLPAICDAVKDQVTILADGGVRSGGDVLKLLALGADAVMIGRPFCVAAVGGGQAGVESYIDKIKTELEQAMVLTGVKKASQVPGNIIFRSV